MEKTCMYADTKINFAQPVFVLTTSAGPNSDFNKRALGRGQENHMTSSPQLLHLLSWQTLVTPQTCTKLT